MLNRYERGHAHPVGNRPRPPARREQLLPLVSDELRAHEQPGKTLQATALVHEASFALLFVIDLHPRLVARPRIRYSDRRGPIMPTKQPSSTGSAEALLAELRQLDLLDAAQLNEAAAKQPFPDAIALAKHLVRSRLLTLYQANEVLRGRGRNLLLGQYCLLEPLGQGGMGQVFKARHRLMRRIVALKVIRQELLERPEALQRFRRELQMAAQLSHPNIVTAYDAEQIGNRCCLVMEFCEGDSLAQRVHRHGPLPVAEACALMRQAALGLQHAHERGLIHRDIKPENLLCTGQALKILDMGLARLQAVDGEASGMTLTREGVIMGTPDFIAPEQAKDLRLADIRSDLYSLGCTFYFALTGRVPFLGGTLVEKLLRHQAEAPPPLQELRPEVPAEVGALVDRMMSKDPADRFQTPREVAVALEPFATGWTAAGVTDTSAGVSEVPGGTLAGTLGGAPTFQARAGLDRPPSPDAKQGAVRSRTGAASPAAKHGTPLAAGIDAPLRRRRPSWAWWAGGGALALCASACLATILWPDTSIPKSSPPPPTKDPPVSPTGKGKVTTMDQPLAWKWAAAGELSVQPGMVVGLSLSADGTRLAVACGDWKAPHKLGEVQLWDVASQGKIVAVPRVTGLKCVALSADGRFLAWGVFGKKDEAAALMLWEVARDVKHLIALSGHKTSVTSLTFHPTTHNLVSSGTDLRIRVWQTPDGAELAQVPSTGAPATGLSFSDDGALLATITSTRLVGLKDFKARHDHEPPLEGRIMLGSPSAVALNRQGTIVAAAVAAYSDLTPEVRLWNVADGQPFAGVLSHGANVRGLAFTPDGAGLVTAAEDGLARVWDVRTRTIASTLEGHVGPIYALAMSRDGSVLVTGGADRIVRLWRRVDPER
jgi:serine/threonine-protein kinase